MRNHALLCLCLLACHVPALLAARAGAVMPALTTPSLDDPGVAKLRTLAREDPEVADLLNVALTQEYLASTFFCFAATGHGLPDELSGHDKPPKALGARKAELTPAVQRMAESVAADEVSHVRLLRDILGDKALPLPQLDLGDAFAKSADMAGILNRDKPVSPPYDPYNSDLDFLIGAFFLADLEPSAYTGLAATIAEMDVGASVIVTRMMAVEAYHSGAVRALLVPQVNRKLYPREETVGQMVSWLAKLRSYLDGSSPHGAGVDTCGGTGEGAEGTEGGDDDQGGDTESGRKKRGEAHDCALEGLNGQPVTASRNKRGLVQVRTLDETILVLCAGRERCKGGGGFFPEGIPLFNEK